MARPARSRAVAAPVLGGAVFSTDDLIAEALREADMRARLYPRLVLRGQFSQAESLRRIAMMRAVARRLGVDVPPDAQHRFTLRALIDEAQAELRTRRRTYPGHVAAARMGADLSARRIAMMEAIVGRLRALALG
jgi:hypothetical protein